MDASTFFAQGRAAVQTLAAQSNDDFAASVRIFLASYEQLGVQSAAVNKSITDQSNMEGHIVEEVHFAGYRHQNGR